MPSMPPLTLAADIADLPLLTTLAAGLAAAWVFGLLTKRLGLSPIVGYLLGGVIIGPHTPGFVGDEKIAHQLAEIGVILMMFGVGLHFDLKDLVAVRRIAIPGAIVQSLAATIVGTVVFLTFGWPWQSGMVIGMAMAVASTVVLLRVLMDTRMLATPHGHAAVGWLVVEDIFTVLALVLVPMLAVGDATETVRDAAGSDGSMLVAVAVAIGKFALMVAILLLAGSRVIPWMLARVARLRSRELFTLTVLVLSIAIAVGSAALFGVSVALGAFLAGMVVSQSPTSHQAAADALPLRDAFAVLFFVAVGMLFDPGFVIREPLMLAAGLGIVMIVKPIAAIAVGSAALFGVSVALGAFLAGMVVSQSPTSHQAAADALPLRDAFAVLFFVAVGMLFDPGFVIREPLMLAAGVGIVMIVKPIAAIAIVAILGHPARTALTVALGLAQIGEFSFILGQVALLNGVIPAEGQQVLVGTAMISITLNPLLFGSLDRIEAWARGVPWLWNLLEGRAARVQRAVNETAGDRIAAAEKPLAIVVGYGPVGRLVDGLLIDAGFHTVVVELNIQTAESLTARRRSAVFGDASRPEILEHAGIRRAEYLVLTHSHAESRSDLIQIARELNPGIRIIMRARYLAEAEAISGWDRTIAVYEEGETGLALARKVLEIREMEPARIEAFLDAVRKLWRLRL